MSFKSGANPATSEFTTTYNARVVVGLSDFTKSKKIFLFSKLVVLLIFMALAL
jgi:hypothetical protein